MIFNLKISMYVSNSIFELKGGGMHDASCTSIYHLSKYVNPLLPSQDSYLSHFASYISSTSDMPKMIRLLKKLNF